jgi:hypothetical protein
MSGVKFCRVADSLVTPLARSTCILFLHLHDYARLSFLWDSLKLN